MPELPEVEHVRKILRDHLTGHRLHTMRVYDEELLKNCSPGEIQKHLSGTILNTLERRGKYLLFQFDGWSMVTHMRMSGRWLFSEGDRTRLSLTFESGNSVFFDDLRRLGTLHLVERKNGETLKRLDELGPDPVQDHLSDDEFDRISNSRQEIKRLLMDQKKIAGVGNIYACETLFEAGIHPERQANSLNREERRDLLSSLSSVLQKAIEKQGTSIDSLYRTPSGQPGNFQYALRVYDREGETCHHCDEEIHRIKQGQRSTYFCSICQE